MSVKLDGETAILLLRGELDHVGAAILRSTLDVVIDQQPRSVVLDLADLLFMDAAGLEVFAAGARRLSLGGASLVIRTPSAMVRRLLAITRLDTVVHLEDEDQAEDHLAMAQSTISTMSPLRTLTPGASRPLRRVMSAPADHDVVDGALRMVVMLARSTVGGADGVSVSLRRNGRLGTLAASDQTVLDMDADQYATAEGPCIDASLTGEPFHAEALSEETRWPAFTPRARSLGINAILSSPLLAGDQPVGALNIYSRAPAAFTPHDQSLASMFAAEASIVLTDAGVHVTEDAFAGRLQEALRTREIIALAQGVLMERAGLTESQAYTVLRRCSIQTSQPLLERSQAIVSSAGGLRPAGEATDV